MKQMVIALTWALVCLSWTVGCGGRLEAEKPEKFEPLPKKGPVGTETGVNVAPPLPPH